MAPPLEPPGPATPARPPLRHRVPGQSRGKGGSNEGYDKDAGEGSSEEEGIDRGSGGNDADDEAAPPSQRRDDSGGDGHLIDDYA